MVSWYRKMLLMAFAFLLAFLLAIEAYAQLDNDLPRHDTIHGASMEMVVVTASRTKESLLKAPQSITKAGRPFFAASSSPTFFDALEQLRGVQMITPGIGFRILNTRGFTNTANVRFAQLVDGMDVQSPHISAPIGNVLGPTDLDIKEVEIVSGVAASLYGMNATNGLANITTIDAFEQQGLCVMQKTAVSHFKNSSLSPRVFSETALRWASAIGSRWAIKINAAYTRGTDWIADDNTDMASLLNSSTGLVGSNNPAYNGVNVYGNEGSNRRIVAAGGKSYYVARTGYTEMAVNAYDIAVMKGDVNLVYRLNEASRLSYTGRFALMNNTYQRANRFKLEDYFITQQGIQLSTPNVKANLYFNAENTGNSYNLRSMAENIERAHAADDAWFDRYSNVLEDNVAAGIGIAQAHAAARSAADEGRFVAGADNFDSVLRRLQQVNNWDSGAALKVRASFIQADAIWSLSNFLFPAFFRKNSLELTGGFDHRSYFVVPDGNYFINPAKEKASQNIVYGKTGAFLLAHKNLFDKKLRLGAAIRADKNDYFKLYWSPRMTALYAFSTHQTVRFSWQSGYRFPNVFEAFSNVNSGGVKRVGGLPVMSNGIFENAWLYSSIAAFQNAVLQDVNSAGLSKEQAIVKNSGLLQKNLYSYVVPERVRSVEVGYRGLLLRKQLFVDIDMYWSKYTNFIAQANMNVPLVDNPDLIPEALNHRKSQAFYRMYTNSKSAVYNYGISASFIFSASNGYRISANTTHAKLLRQEAQDGLEDGFNTPPWMVNIGVSKQQILKHGTAGINWRWQDAFYWQSFLVSGDVKMFSTLDAHLQWSFSRSHITMKLGANNLLNKYYRSFLGGPAIGGFYYATFFIEIEK